MDLERLTIDGFLARAQQSMRPGTRVLDAGSGEGRYRHLFETSFLYTAVDFCKVRDGIKEYGPVDVCGTLARLPFGGGTFDYVLCIQVLEHVPDPQQVISDLFRVLKPGGRLFLTAPQGWGEHEVPYDYFRFTSFGLRLLFETSGFIVESIEPRGGIFLFASQVMRFIPDAVARPSQLHKRLLWRATRPVLKLAFRHIVPGLARMFDPLDRDRRWTLGYACRCVKPGPAASC